MGVVMKTGTLKELNVKPGDVVECICAHSNHYTTSKRYSADMDGNIWNNKGFVDPSPTSQFRVVSRASHPEPPKLWRDMTREEKGALLLAEYEGRDIQQKAGVSWVLKIKSHKFLEEWAYRVKPEPKRQTVKLYFGELKQGALLHKVRTDTHRITFNLIDGKPDPKSIKMEPF
jgi:hypothetical protein